MRTHIAGPSSGWIMRFQAPESLSEQIAQHLGQQIILGNLRPKERIQEIKISKELDVSRGSVREALLILQGRHLVEIYPRKGAIVSAMSEHHVACLYDIYINLLTMLATRFADVWQDHDFKPLLDQVQRINRLVLNEETPLEIIVEAGFTLMRLCFKVVNNPYLEETLENFRPAVSRTYHLAMQFRREETYQSMKFYNGLVKVVQTRDHDGIREVIENYGHHQQQLVLSVLREQDTFFREKSLLLREKNTRG
jgi:DNA-binding GntR family transcriptional regulator